MLLFLCVLGLLAGAAAQQTITATTTLDITSCPITYYGQTFNQIYASLLGSTLTLCFGGYFSPGAPNNCLEGLNNINQIQFTINSRSADSEASFQSHLPTITNAQACSITFSFLLSGQNASLVLSSFGTQAAASLEFNSLGTLTFHVSVGGFQQGEVSITNTADSQQTPKFLDMSACRYLGKVIFPNAPMQSDANTCTNVTCGATAVLTIATCGPSSTCQGSNNCVKDNMLSCTVTGPSVIDFSGSAPITMVPDRCAYTLLTTSLLSSFQLVALFQERRREDLSLLNSVMLIVGTPNVSIRLDQGGEVYNGLDLLNLTVPATINDVQLSKDMTGVTAVLSLSSYKVSIFFNGYTAQIFLQGPGTVDPAAQGLCADSTKVWADLKYAALSVPGCDTKYTQDPDTSIIHDAVVARCSSLRNGVFTPCITVVSPSPYFNACGQTLSVYPMVDELDCQFLHAYARACSLQGISIADSWMSDTGCPSQAFCQHRTCLDNEFCAARFVGGDTSCFCRAIYASQYSPGTFGSPTVCGPDAASLTLVGCLLEEQGIDYSTLQLNDPTCTGQVDKRTNMVTFSFSNSASCGTVVRAQDEQIIYENAITSKNNSDGIERQNKVNINITCVHTQPGIQTTSFRIKDSSVTVHVKTKSWNYNLTMTSYTDPTRTHVLQADTQVQLDQTIWVELDTVGLEGGSVSVVTDSCWATKEALATDTLRYNLITNGCPNPVDSTVRTYGNGLGLSNYFSFSMFQFAAMPGDIYLHCRVELCITGKDQCVPTCTKRRRRRRAAEYAPNAAAFISMGWIN